MAELADAADSKSAEGNLVGVRPPLPAPKILKGLFAKWPLHSERPFLSVAVLVSVRFLLVGLFTLADQPSGEIPAKPSLYG